MKGVRRISVLGLMVSLTVILVWGSRWLDAKEKKKVNVVMKKKLKYAQAALKAVARQDFGEISGAAASLTALSHQGDWQVVKHEQYLTYSNDFRRAVAAMSTAAKSKNIDGAALGYVQMTLSCVNCHKWIREVRKTE